MVFKDAVVIAHDHPSLAGHYPDRPEVPEAVLLDRLIALVATQGKRRVIGIEAAKFAAPMRTGVPAQVSAEEAGDALLRVVAKAGAAVLFDGRFLTTPLEQEFGGGEGGP